MNKSVVFSLLLGGAFTSFSSSAAQNEVSFGVSDLNNYGDDFVGLEYKRYLSNITPGEQPYSISPYLNKVDSVYVRYFGVDWVANYDLGGQWFKGDKWVIDGRLRYTDYDSNYRDKYVAAAADVGYFLSPDWQVGGGLIYEYADGSYLGSHISDNETTVKIFSRYTKIVKNSGWDFAVEGLINDSTRIEMDVRYFFNQRFSAGLAYLTEFTDEEYDYISSDVVEFNIDYWFNPGWSIQAGAGVYSGGDESGLATVTLSTAVRF